MSFSNYGELERDLEGLSNRTALYAFNDHVAFVILRLCSKLEIQVPERLAVLGTDDCVHACQIASPPLSSIDVDFQRLGYLAANSLIKQIRDECELENGFGRFPPRQVVERDSTICLGFADECIEQTIAHIKSHYFEDINVQHIVEKVGLSRRILDQRFSSKMGYTIADELRHVRVSKAAGLLSSSVQSVGEIAARCGFRNQAHFCKVFKRYMDATPLEYRNYFETNDEH